jgi:hypothetical protein
MKHRGPAFVPVGRRYGFKLAGKPAMLRHQADNVFDAKGLRHGRAWDLCSEQRFFTMAMST